MTPTPPPPPPPSAPPTVRPVPAQAIWIGDTVELSMTTYFTDPEGEALTFRATSSDDGVLTTALAGPALTLEAVGEGLADVTLSARDSDGQVAVTAFRATAEYGDSASVAAPVTPGETITAELGPEDNDWFAVTVPTDGFRLSMSTEGEIDTAGTLQDSAGTVLAFNNNSAQGDGFRIVRQLYADRTYYLLVRGFRGATGSYSLILEEVTESDDDHGDLPLTATPTALLGMAHGVLTPSDIDIFEITVPADHRLLAYTTGATDTYGHLYDADGAVIISDDDSGPGNNFRVTADVSAGTYYVGVRGFHDSDGEYTLNLEEREPDDHGNGIVTATTVSVGDTVHANLIRDDQDFFEVAIPSDSFPLRVFTEGTSDTYGHLYDADSDEIARNDDDGAGTNFLIDETLAAGTYYVMVRGYEGQPGDYTLILGEGGDADADRFRDPFGGVPKAMPEAVQKDQEVFPGRFPRLRQGRARRPGTMFR